MTKHRSTIAADLRTPKYRKRICRTKLEKVRDSRKPSKMSLAEWLSSDYWLDEEEE